MDGVVKRLFCILALLALPGLVQAQAPSKVGPLQRQEVPVANLLGGTGGGLTGVAVGTGLTLSGGDLTVTYGATAGTAAQGNDGRITGAVQAANDLSDLHSAPTARANLNFLPDSGFAPRRNRMTWAPGGWPLTDTIGSTKTAFYAVTIPDDAYAVRFITVTMSGIGGSTLGPIRYRSSTAPNDYVNPLDVACAGGGSCWDYATFNSGGADTGDLIRDCCSPSTLVMPSITSPDPQTGSTNTARLVYSDWNRVVPLAPDAGPTAPRWMFARVVEPAGTLARFGSSPSLPTSGGSAVWTGNSAINQGYDASLRTKVGDIETDASVTGTTAGQGPLWAIQFMTRSRGVVIVQGGDSHPMGLTTTSDMASPGQLAAVNLSSQALPVMLANAGWTGASSDMYLPFFLDAIQATQPSICLLQTWSANDANTTAGMARVLGRALQVAQKCQQAGARSLFITPYPRDAATLTGATLTAWQHLYAEVMGMAAAGYMVADVTAAVGVFWGGVPTGAWTSGMSNDSIHGNQTGANAGAVPVQAAIKKLSGMQ